MLNPQRHLTNAKHVILVLDTTELVEVNSTGTLQWNTLEIP